MSLSRHEIERCKFTFSIYDFEGNDKIDANQLGNALRAMGLTPTLRRISNLGGTRTSKEKTLTVEEFLAIYQEAKTDKQEGTYEDYLEVLSSYDKDHSGTLTVNTLASLLMGYGEEKLDRDEVEEIILDCGDPYQDQVYYKDFIKNLMKGPEIRVPPALLIQQARAGLGSDENPEAEEILGNEIRRRGSSTKKQTARMEESDNGETASVPKENDPPKNDPSDSAGEQGISRTRTRDSVKSNRTRDSTKSNAASDQEATRRGSAQVDTSGDKSTSRRGSAKAGAASGGSRRGTSPDVSCASEASSTGKGTAIRKRASIQSGPDNQNPDASPVANSSGGISRKSSRKSVSGKRESVKSNATTGEYDEDDRELSADEGACVSEMSVGVAKSISRTRDSQKSDILEREASPDESWASDTTGTDIPKARSRSSLKVKDTDGGKISPYISAASEANEDMTKSRSSLKSAGSRSSGKSSRKSEKKEEDVKAKFQQPLISLKTDGLFGKKKE